MTPGATLFIPARVSRPAGLNGVAGLAPAGRVSTPSPPGPDLPPLRHVSKVKRFLTTLQKFGLDISEEVGERVRGLILSVVVSREGW